MKKRLSSRGFTLPEILIASLITIILLGAVGSVFLTALNLFDRGEAMAYKSGSITNVETNLQNKLAVANKVEIVREPLNEGTLDGDFYYIGFNTERCEEAFGEVIKEGGVKKLEYPIDQLSEIILTTTSERKMLKYKLVPKNGMSTLEGGIVVNNVSDLAISETLNKDHPGYLLIR